MKTCRSLVLTQLPARETSDIDESAEPPVIDVRILPQFEGERIASFRPRPLNIAARLTCE